LKCFVNQSGNEQIAFTLPAIKKKTGVKKENKKKIAARNQNCPLNIMLSIQQMFFGIVSPPGAVGIRNKENNKVGLVFILYVVNLFLCLMGIVSEVPFALITFCLVSVFYLENFQVGLVFILSNPHFDVCLRSIVDSKNPLRFHFRKSKNEQAQT
jgi:hypothetical protein